MDLFDDNEDKDDDNNANVYMKFAVDVCNVAFIEIMRLKPFIKRTGEDKATTIHRNILVIGRDNDDVGCATLLLVDKLQGAQFKDVILISDLGTVDQHSQFDVVINLNFDTNNNNCSEHVITGGTYMTIGEKQGGHRLATLKAELWNYQKAVRKIVNDDGDCNKEVEFIAIQKRCVIVNTLGALYWTDTKNDRKLGYTKTKNDRSIDTSSYHSLLDKEYMNLDEVSVSLSYSERELGVFSDASHNKAVHALNEYGLCILPGLFPSGMIMDWGAAALNDMSAAIIAMKTRGIDLFRAGDEGPRIENFHELSMREALRCDLRNGEYMKACTKNKAVTIDENDNVRDIRHHESVLQVLKEVMNPIPRDERYVYM